ncbi:hypothetical protein BDW75DRAFT_203758 [Aspergillus navahoensis]
MATARILLNQLQLRLLYVYSKSRYARLRLSLATSLSFSHRSIVIGGVHFTSCAVCPSSQQSGTTSSPGRSRPVTERKLLMLYNHALFDGVQSPKTQQ